MRKRTNAKQKPAFAQPALSKEVVKNFLCHFMQNQFWAIPAEHNLSLNGLRRRKDTTDHIISPNHAIQLEIASVHKIKLLCLIDNTDNVGCQMYFLEFDVCVKIQI